MPATDLVTAVRAALAAEGKHLSPVSCRQAAKNLGPAPRSHSG